MYDILIKNATIIDGTGNKSEKSNLIINKDIIEFISKDTEYKANTVIDADNLILTPGFIDVNNHSDTSLNIFNQSSLKSLSSQGITTIIGGNCGGSLAPLMNIDSLKSIQKWTNLSKFNINWQSIEEYYTVLSEYKMHINYASLIGYSTVRRGFLREEIRPLTDKEIEYIINFVDKALDQGALGVSLGLAFTHSQLIGKDELLLLAKLIKKHNKILTIHLRNESEKILQSVCEVIDIVKQTSVKVEINHLKILGAKNWKYFDDVIEILNEAIYKDGLPIKFDVFPYNYNNGVLYLYLPKWLTENGRYIMLKELANINVKNKAIQDMMVNTLDYSNMVISEFRDTNNFAGKTIQEIANNQEVSIEEAIINLIIASEGQIKVMINSIHHEHINKLVFHQNSLISTDGIGYDDSYFEKKLYDHPRCFYTIPKYFYNYVKDTLSLEKAVSKLTHEPAKHYGIKKRGLIKEGYIADINLIDMGLFSKEADFDRIDDYQKGIEYQLISGEFNIKNGEFQDFKNGKIIK